MQLGDNGIFLAHTLQRYRYLTSAVAHVIQALRLGQRHKDRTLFGIAHAQVIDADNGHGALAHGLIFAPPHQRHSVVHVHFEQVGQPAANHNHILITVLQITAGAYVFGLNADGRFDHWLQPGNGHGKRTFAAADQPGRVNAFGSGHDLRIAAHRFHHGICIGQWQ